MKPGDILISDSGEKFTLMEPLAYRGKLGCTNLFCATKGDEDSCYGWHCSRCDEPTSMMGHECDGKPRS